MANSLSTPGSQFLPLSYDLNADELEREPATLLLGEFDNAPNRQGWSNYFLDLTEKKVKMLANQILIPKFFAKLTTLGDLLMWM